MLIEDARELAVSAAGQLVAQSGPLAPELNTQGIPDFLAYSRQPQFRLTLDQKQTILDQATLIIDQFYAHLPFKRARYAVDPLQSLRLIGAHLAGMDDLDFHAAVLRVFVGLRDAHTFYGLPEPFSGAVAFLPFSVGCCEGPAGRRFLVTAVMFGFVHEQFKECAEITAWNGMTVERAIARDADRVAGANPAALFKRGLGRLTFRSLTHSMPPEEQWVVLEYIAPDDASATRRGILLPWQVMTGAPGHTPVPDLAASMCHLLETAMHWRGILVGGVSQPPAPEQAPGQSTLPDVFEYQRTGGVPGAVDPAYLVSPDHPGKRFGYIRIKTFNCDPQKFFDEFRRILDDEMEPSAPDGLILDVRSNPGGVIEAGERILQLLTPREIQPAQFHFVNSRLTQKVMARADRLDLRARGEWQPWVSDAPDAAASGSEITQGRPLTPPDVANGTGQRYHGPVVLITDALSYSATDIFCGGFQDNRVGTVVGVDENTGGGGASRWLHSELVANIAGIADLGVESLPMGASMALASRRSTRVGPNAGTALEDTGVKCDIRYNPTPDDLLYGDRGLLRFACAQLAAMPAYRLQIAGVQTTDTTLEIHLRTAGLTRVEFLLDGNSQMAAAAQAEQTVFLLLQGLPSAPEKLQVKGYATVTNEDLDTVKLVLVAVASLALPAVDARATRQSA